MIAALAILLVGCAARRPVARGRVVIPRGCILALEPDENTECAGPDAKHLRCAPVKLTRQVGCEVFDVRQEEKEQKK